MLCLFLPAIWYIAFNNSVKKISHVKMKMNDQAFTKNETHIRTRIVNIKRYSKNKRTTAMDVISSKSTSARVSSASKITSVGILSRTTTTQPVSLIHPTYSNGYNENLTNYQSFNKYLLRTSFPLDKYLLPMETIISKGKYMAMEMTNTTNVHIADKTHLSKTKDISVRKKISTHTYVHNATQLENTVQTSKIMQKSHLRSETGLPKQMGTGDKYNALVWSTGDLSKINYHNFLKWVSDIVSRYTILVQWYIIHKLLLS